MTGKSMIAYCGITCSECPAFEATRDRDQRKLAETLIADTVAVSYGPTRDRDKEKLAETAAKWSTSEMKFEPEDILCDGCLSDRVFKWSIECPTRRCGMERGVDNCGPCRDYHCGWLRDHWAKFGDVGARCQSTLDQIKTDLKI